MNSATPPVSISRTIFIASTPRTGSTLLSKGLAGTGSLGRPSEILNLSRPKYLKPISHRDPSTRFTIPTPRPSRFVEVKSASLLGRGPISARAFTHRSWERYLIEAAQFTVSDSGVFSTKAHWSQFSANMLACGFDPTIWGAPVTWVRTIRSNRIAQAVSLYRARSSGQWRLAQAPRANTSEIEYSSRGIESALRDIERQEHAWKTFFQQRAIEPLLLEFEAISSDLEGQVRRIASVVGVRLDGPDGHLSSLVIENKKTSALEWEVRFRSEHSRLDACFPFS